MRDSTCILLVGGSDRNLVLVRQALVEAQLCQPPLRVRYIHEAVAHLLGLGLYGNRSKFPLPTLIVLDLNLPDPEARDFLAWFRRQPDLVRTPVLVLAAAQHLGDVAPMLGSNALAAAYDDLPGITLCLHQLLAVRPSLPAQIETRLEPPTAALAEPSGISTPPPLPPVS